MWGRMWGTISVKSILEISKTDYSTDLENTLKHRCIESAFLLRRGRGCNTDRRIGTSGLRYDNGYGNLCHL